MSNDSVIQYPNYLVIPTTAIYGIILISGVLGNISTCIVISRNKSMHTSTNFYLFSLAISDLLLLVFGLPPEVYHIWFPQTYVFGEIFCVVQAFTTETSANATVLTITAFTIERYVAVCHPFKNHAELQRVVKYIAGIWITALCLATPQALQVGVVSEVRNAVLHSRCTIASKTASYCFQVSTLLLFFGPMTLITVFYILIGIKLRKSKKIILKRESLSSTSSESKNRNNAAQRKVLKMLVVVAFFLCWAPFHAQRLLGIYLRNASKESQRKLGKIYLFLVYTSGILYFLSTTINPILYNIVSHKYRRAFKKTFSCKQSYSFMNSPRPASDDFHLKFFGSKARRVSESTQFTNLSN